MRGGWRKLHNDEIHELHYSQNIIMLVSSLVHAVMIDAHKLVILQPERKIRFGKQRHRRENVTKINLE